MIIEDEGSGGCFLSGFRAAMKEAN